MIKKFYIKVNQKWVKNSHLNMKNIDKKINIPSNYLEEKKYKYE